MTGRYLTLPSPSSNTNPPAGASGLVLWAAPSLLHCELQQRALLGWTRPDWTGFFHPRHHRAVLEGSLLTQVHDLPPHVNQTGRGDIPGGSWDDQVARSVCVSRVHVSHTACHASARSLSAGRTEMMMAR